MSRRVCQYQNKSCGYQNYLEGPNDPEKCFYCSHFSAFHLGFTSNETPNFGACQKYSAHCGCQGFGASSENALICRFCDHFNAFHLSVTPSSSSSNNNVLDLLLQLPASFNNPSSSSTVGNRQYLTPREEVLSNFRPQTVAPPNLNMSSIRRRHNNQNTTTLQRGRPKSVSLHLNHILLFKDNLWRDQQAPREHSNKWKEMVDGNQIVSNVSFETDTPNTINELIREIFLLNNEDIWIILNCSTNKLNIASSQVLIYIYYSITRKILIFIFVNL
jgi:hypothetical protein